MAKKVFTDESLGTLVSEIKSYTDTSSAERATKGHGIYYGTCATAAATAAKVVTLTDATGFSLTTGAVVIVKFTNANSASNPTLNVNSTGAKSIMRYGTTAASTSSSTSGWVAGAVMVLVYDGTNWVRDYWANSTYSNVALGQGYATCSTAAATTAKVGTLSSYTLSTGGIVSVKFTYAVPASATLNINSKGAKSIYYRGAAITADVIKAGDVATFIYNGSQYHLLSIDRWQNDIDSLQTQLDSKSDEFVKVYTNDSSDEAYPIIFSNSTLDSMPSDGENQKDYVAASSGLTYNPSTGLLNVNGNVNVGDELTVTNGIYAPLGCWLDDGIWIGDNDETYIGTDIQTRGLYLQDTNGETTVVLDPATATYTINGILEVAEEFYTSYLETNGLGLNGDMYLNNGTGVMNPTDGNAFGFDDAGYPTILNHDGRYLQIATDELVGNYANYEFTEYSGFVPVTEGQGTSGQVLTSNGNGTYTWGDASCPLLSGGTITGNLTISQDIDANNIYAANDLGAVTAEIEQLTVTDSLTLNGSNVLTTSDYITAGAADGTTIGSCATAEGMNNTVSGANSHASGANNTVSGANSHAEGANNTVSGLYSHAEGFRTTASGTYAHAEGNNTTAGGTYSHAAGLYTGANDYQYVVGKYNANTLAPTGISDTTTGAGLFIVGIGTSNTARSNGFRINPAGKVYGTGTFGTSGADYAEYFEWLDGNPNNEDRRGHFVTLEGGKIRYATPNDDYILGVVSADPSVAGDIHSEDWHNRYLKDVFGSKIVEVVEVEETTNEDGEIIPAHTERRWVLNPDYNPDVKYVSREERPEWAAIGIVGKLVVVDDGTCQVNGYCYPNADGIATASQEKTNYRVMERLDDTHIRIFIR